MSSLHFDADITDEKLNRKLKIIDNNIDRIGRQAVESGSVMDNAFKKSEQSADGLGLQLGSLKNQLAGLASIAVFVNLAKEIVDVRGEFQKFQAVLTNTLNGDDVRASELLSGLSDFAAKTPYQLNDITENFVKLANQGVILTQQELKKLGDFAAVTGKPIGQLFEAIMDINNPERWKEFGTRIQTEGEKVMISFRGQKVEFDRTVAGAKDAIAQLGSMEGVAGTMSVISETLEGQISNFEDAWDRMLNNLGKDNEDIFSGAISGATSLIENYKDVVDSLKGLIATFGAAKAVAIVYNLVMKEKAAVNAMVAASNGVFTRSLALQWLWTERAQKTQALLNKTMLTNPYVLAAAAIAALIAGVVILNRRFEESIDAKKKFDEQTATLNETYQERIDKANSLISTLKSETEAESKRISALNELKEMYPNIFGEMDIHSAKLKGLQTETKLLNEEEAKLNLQRQKEYIHQLVLQRNQIEKDIDIRNTQIQAGSPGAALQLQYDLKKLDQINLQIELENDRYNKLLIDQIDAQQAAREESEKTIQQRIKEAKSIEAIGKLKEEWEKKYKTATTDSDRAKLLTEVDMIDAALKRMNGKGKAEEDGVTNKALNRIKKLKDKLGTGDAKFEAEIILKIAKEQEFLDQFDKEVRKRLNEAREFNITDAFGKNEKIKLVGTRNIIGKKDIQEQLKPMKQLTAEEEKRLKTQEKQLDKLHDQQGQYETLSIGLKDASDVIGALSYAVSDLDSELGQSLAKMADLAYSASNLFENISTGNILQAVASGIAVIGNIISSIKNESNTSELEKGIAAVNRNLEIQAALLANLSGENWFSLATKQAKDYATSIQLATKQLQGFKVMSVEGQRLWEQNMNRPYAGNIFATLYEKYKVDVVNWEVEDFVKAIADGIIQLDTKGQEILDNAVAAKAELATLLDDTWDRITGTTRDSIADSIIEGFRNGYDSAADFADNFEDLMKTAIIKSFKTQLLEGDLTKWYQDFYETAKDGLTDEEIAERKAAWDALVTSAKTAWDSMENITKIDFSTNKGGYSALTGSSISATEESVSLLYGQTMAMRVDLKSIADSSKLIKNQLEIMDQSLGVLQNIEKNTRYNVKLETIANGVAETNKILREKLS